MPTNLRGQLRALHDCGVVTDEAYDAADEELDAAVKAARQRRQLGFSVGHDQSRPDPAVSFVRVLAIGKPLAVHGGRCRRHVAEAERESMSYRRSTS
jgi:hypothetical protein